MKVIRLTDEEREFCKLVSMAGISNHFSMSRLELDSRIACLPSSTDKKKIFGQVIENLTKFITAMELNSKADVRIYCSEDREIVAFTLLFDIFHKLMNDIDEHIIQQIEAGEKPITVTYAPKAIEMFKRRGFDNEETVLFMGIFFQMRRAYFFIENQIVGNSPCMVKLRENLWSNVFTNELIFYNRYLINRMEDFSTLILGDTGSGKGTAAAAIGRSGYIPFDIKTNTFSQSFTQTYMSINLSQFSQGLIESELFGHRKGAFTGAVDEHAGIFDRCSIHGAIFLDEIGDVSIPVQIKLLQILQERTFSPIGSHKKHRFEGRVIAATNKDISELRQKGEFRDDFFYRLCSDIIVMPSLAQRIAEDNGELKRLVSHVVKRIVGVEHEVLVAEILHIIEKQLSPSYPWPGNVRELEQCVRRIILKKEYRGDYEPANDIVSSLISEINTEKLGAEELLGRYCSLLYQRHHSYEAVSAIAGLDRRTVKKYIENTTCK